MNASTMMRTFIGELKSLLRYAKMKYSNKLKKAKIKNRTEDSLFVKCQWSILCFDKDVRKP